MLDSALDSVLVEPLPSEAGVDVSDVSAVATELADEDPLVVLVDPVEVADSAVDVSCGWVDVASDSRVVPAPEVELGDVDVALLAESDVDIAVDVLELDCSVEPVSLLSTVDEAQAPTPQSALMSENVGRMKERL